MATPFEQRIIRDVDEYGWFGMSVGLRRVDADKFCGPTERVFSLAIPGVISTATDFQTPKEAS